ncbi:Ribosomal L29 family protein [Perilla frutescens var. frutescens]|nr:Ribosomal L29 family protein [Perilla frutescens var. frutescens]
MARIKVHELRQKNKAELALLHVAKVTGGAPNKLSKIEVVNSFAESHRLDGSSTVYRGRFNGDEATMKVIKGSFLSEIDALRHSRRPSLRLLPAPRHHLPHLRVRRATLPLPMAEETSPARLETARPNS